MARVFAYHRIIVAVAVVCVVLTAGQAPAVPVPTDNLAPKTPAAAAQIPEIQDAVKRFSNRDFDGAYALLQKAVKRKTDLPPAQVLMAELFARANQANGVRNWLERAVAELPDDPHSYLMIGQLALPGGRVTEADLAFQKASSLLEAFKATAKRKKTLQGRALSGLASAAEARAQITREDKTESEKQWKLAQKHLDDWLALGPEKQDKVAATQRLGRALFHLGQPEEALNKLKDAAKIDKEVLTPEATLAWLYEQAGDRENARKYMIAALKIAPKDLKTRLEASRWSLQTEQLDDAREQATLALKLDPESLDAKLMRGNIAFFLKDFETAERYLESAHIQSPSNFMASNNLALALAEQDDPKKRRRALEYARGNAQQFSDRKEAFSTLGWVYYKLGNLADAERELRKAARGGLSLDTAYYLAQVYADQGKDEDAKKLLEKALEAKGFFSQRDDAKALLDKLKK